MIVAVHTDNLFSDILIGLHIDTVTRDIDRKLITVKFGSEVEVCKNTDDVFIRDFDSENAVYTCDAYSELSGLDGISCIHIESSFRDFTAS